MIDDSIENLYLKFGRPKSKDDCENKRFYYILEEIERYQKLLRRCFLNIG